MRCEICGKPASVCQIDDNSRRTVRSFCIRHAPFADSVAAAVKEAHGGMVGKLEQLLAFLKKHRRLPQESEEEFSAVGNVQYTGSQFHSIAEQILFLERVLAYEEKYGRFPEEEEIGRDPF